MAPDEIRTGVSYLSGELPQGRIGLGYATVYGIDVEPAELPELTLADVDTSVDTIARTSGPGSQQRRRDTLTALLGSATADEQDFLRALLLRELRQGALENSMADAVAEVIGAEPAAVRRAVMLGGQLIEVAVAALTEGPAGLDNFRLTVLRPIRPMLARSAADVDEALNRHRPASIEVKLDGARIQLHKDGDEIAIFTRNLRDVADYLPEIAEEAATLPVGSIILDGEAIALDDGGPQPFQVTMSRFGRKLDVDEMRLVTPLSAFYFDCLYVDGEPLIDLPAEARWDRMAAVVPATNLPRRLVTGDPTAARVFYDAVLESGHEGVMVKSLDAAYSAGRRGAGWLKVKPAHTLDLVVLAVEWGSGRRSGWLSNLHLGARDHESGAFVMLGKTFKGLTDETLAWQTQRFLELETHRDGHVVHVRPEQVVEIAFDGIQASSRYPGGMALRFARVKGYREDKPAEEADTVATVRNLFEG
jgi:DNA ligase-1